MKVEFLYKCGDHVKIKAIEMVGQVDGMMLDLQGKQYRVVYWCNGARKAEWMNDWELELIK